MMEEGLGLAGGEEGCCDGVAVAGFGLRIQFLVWVSNVVQLEMW